MGRLSTTSPTTSSPSLSELIDALPPDRAAAVFTHSSQAADRADSYERLEFLGDSVLELAIAGELYARFPDFDEGQLAKLRSHVVSRASCAVISRELGLDEKLKAHAPDSEEIERLSDNRNVLAALLEAAIAAVYLEHGFAAVERPVVDAFSERLGYALTHQTDHKTALQEELARRGLRLEYAMLDTKGPAHERWFTIAAVVDGQELGVGSGSSKKDAEQLAAREALEQLPPTA